MFGTFRFALAILVIARHLIHAPNVGEYAVSGFFVLSGYLMTSVMHQSYGFSLRGQCKFWLNRGLRLYPIYWIILAFSFFTVLLIGPEISSSYQSNLEIPRDGLDWIANITMVYPILLPNEYPIRLSPTTWALTIELAFYLLISLGASKTKRRVFLWVFLGLAYSLYFVLMSPLEFDRNSLYYSVGAGSLPFSLGAMLYFYRPKDKIILSEVRVALSILGAVSLIALNALLSAYVVSKGYPGFIQTASHFLNISLSVLIVWTLIQVVSTQRAYKIDKWLGDLSYPIYLLHIQVGLIVASFLMPAPETGRSADQFVVFILSTALTCLFAIVLVKLVDGKIQEVRDRVRENRVGIAAP